MSVRSQYTMDNTCMEVFKYYANTFGGVLADAEEEENEVLTDTLEVSGQR